ncbi:MAG TPA: hypothetical protein ENN29_13800 [Candidatus Hydrogenedentes bacterium]|nr:hypothetical protein [Candidatus Hydrogenedentota bacterium]
MKTIYLITMWSGGRPAKKWKSEVKPEPLPQGTGVSFVSVGTRLPVSVIGSISVEEFESGKEELEMGSAPALQEESRIPTTANSKTNNIEPLF